MALTTSIDRESRAAVPWVEGRVRGAGMSFQEVVTQWRTAVREVFDAEVAKEAARLVEERLAGPYTHKYKGVAVTEDQFWAIMKAEGFERPEFERKA